MRVSPLSYAFPVALHLPLFRRGLSGAPSSSYDGLDLAHSLTSYEHTISAQMGFESITVQRQMPDDAALQALREWLGRSTIAVGADGETLAEGQLVTVEAAFGDESRSVSLGDMGNRVYVRFVDASGAAGVTSAVNETTSQGTYGVKELQQAFDVVSATDAAQKAAAVLATFAQPRMDRRSRVGSGDAARQNEVRLTFAGWYATLDWLSTSNTATTSSATDAQAKSLLTSYQATNAFFSTDQTRIAASSRSALDTIREGTTYRRAIEERLASGNSSNQALAWGVYEERRFELAVAADATPTTITYRRSLRDGTIRDASGAVVPWWRVRPNTMYEVQDLIDPGLPSGAQDGAARSYIARVRCSIGRSGISLDLEGRGGETIDSLLARVR